MNTIDYPTISIIIPSYNQGSFIERTLLSIINQEYKGTIEIIVSDGGSKDETVDVLKKYGDKIIWWSAPDKGYVDAVLKGLERATGEIIGIQSSDDFYMENAFQYVADAFIKFPNFSFISGGQVVINLNNEIVGVDMEEGEIDSHRVLFGKPPQQHATFVKREYIDKVGSLRKEVDMCADMDLWYRITHLKPGIYIPKFIGVYQLQPNQRTQTSDKWYSSLVKMVETVESTPFYSNSFKLSEEQKRSLYKFWEIYWASATGNKEVAVQAAKDAIRHIEIYDDRTKDLINSTYRSTISAKNDTVINSNLYSKLKSVINKIFDNTSRIGDKTSFSVSMSEVNWWNEIKL